MTRKIGAHVSSAGGVEKAVERAAAIGANCVQVFSGSPRVWQRPDLATVNTDKVFSKQKELSIDPIFTHSLYLINLASDNPELTRKSSEVINFDLSFDAKVKGAGIIVHVGSHQGRGWNTVKEQIASLISKILEKSPPESHFLIENAAGQKGKIGGDLEEVRWLLDAVKSPQLQWCVDTCHAFASGYSLGKTHSASKRERSLLDEIERLHLEDALACIHVNDSRDPFDSGRDRHENIGDGSIPPEDLRYFLHTIKNVPVILEVPGIEGDGPDAENVARLKKILE